MGLKADLHIHTVLSPCGDIEMTPVAIVKNALDKGLEIIGITDHNSTRQAPIIKKIAARYGLHVLCGAEITTKEEVHVLAFVDGLDKLEALQGFLDQNLVKVPNDPVFFGYQLVVDEDENVLCQEDDLLIGAISVGIDQVAKFVHSLGGVFIPAHIDKKANSLISQLGFVPSDIEADAFELSCICDVGSFFKSNPHLSGRNFISSSDAHFPGDIGKCCTNFDICDFSFASFVEALRHSAVDDFVKN
ncbi:MAG: PHP domain-containing protein [Bacteroidia bacterium]|nr:PHP domain-containing protein [Bacteroidia bacterium]